MLNRRSFLKGLSSISLMFPISLPFVLGKGSPGDSRSTMNKKTEADSKLILSTWAQIHRMNVYELGFRQYEVQVDCLGLTYSSPFPLLLYCDVLKEKDEVEELRSLYVPGRILRVEGEYVFIKEKDGFDITIYFPTFSELTELDMRVAQSCLKGCEVGMYNEGFHFYQTDNGVVRLTNWVPS